MLLRTIEIQMASEKCPEDLIQLVEMLELPDMFKTLYKLDLCDVIKNKKITDDIAQMIYDKMSESFAVLVNDKNSIIGLNRILQLANIHEEHSWYKLVEVFIKNKENIIEATSNNKI